MAFYRVALTLVSMIGLATPVFAATAIPLTVNMNEAAVVTGTPRVAVDVGGQTRYATYTSGSGTSALTFTLSPQAGDVDLDGISVSSPIDLNGGTLKDIAGNNAVLTFTSPNTSGIKVNYPSLGMDFIADADGRYTLNGTVYNDLPSFLTAAGGTYTRASIGTYFDSTGTMQTAASGVPRFDFDPVTHAAKGILLEESRTNSIRNSTMQGGAVGVFPTNWSCAPFDGLSCSVVGSGAEAGIPYVDVRMNGTVSASPTNTNLAVFFESTTQIVAASGQSWALSVPVTVQSGVGNNIVLQIEERTSTGTLLSSSATTATLPQTGALAANRLSWVRALNQASTARVSGSVRFFYSANSVVDMTLRIGMPQLEVGAFPTSYIPTTSAAVTRAADYLQMPTASWFAGSQGTIYANSVSVARGAGNWRRVAEISDGSSSNRIFIGDAGGPTSTFAQVQASGSTEAALTDGVALGDPRRQALAYKANDIAYVLNAGALGVDASAVLPTVTMLTLGSSFSSSTSNAYISGWISSFKYYPQRMANAQLQLLAQ